MSDEPQVIRGIDWESTFPFIQIFRGFRIAIHPSKLLLALLAIILIYVGGTVLDAIWKVSPANRAVVTEMDLYTRSRTSDNPNEVFETGRTHAVSEMKGLQDALKSRYTASTPSDLDAKIKNDLDKAVKAANDEFGRAKDADKERAATIRDGELRGAYDEAARNLRNAHAVDGVGLFDTFTDYELGELNNLARSVRTGNFFNPGGAADSLVGFFAWGPLWAMSYHPFFFTIFGAYFLMIWSIFGGAIARIAAVHVARDEKISVRQALAFSINKFLSFFSAPLIPLVIVLAIGLLVAGVGFLLGNLPGIGGPIIGVLFILALLAGFVMTLVLLGTAGGINLMYPTIGVEGSDSFDAISRSFSYLYARPWRLAFYTIVALVYGSICYLFVRFFIYLMLWLTHFTVGLWILRTAANSAPLFNVMWPDPVSTGRLTYSVDTLTLSGMQALGAWLISIWVHLVVAMLGAFAVSFYFSANTVIYFLMRNVVDATELDDVYLQQLDDEFTDVGTTTTSAEVATPEATTTEPTTTEPTTTTNATDEQSTQPT